MVESMKKNLQSKSSRLQQSSESEEIADLEYEIQALETNIGFCNELLLMEVTWDNYDRELKRLTSSVQDEFSKSPSDNDSQLKGSTESKLQSLSSLKSQLHDKARLRRNAFKFVYGDPEKAGSGIMVPAMAHRRRMLSETRLPNGEYEINALSAELLGRWVKSRFVEMNLSPHVGTILDLYSKSGGDIQFLAEQIAEIGCTKTTPIDEFVRATYSVQSHKDYSEQVKAKLADIYVLELKDQLGIDLRDHHDNRIMRDVCSDVSESDLVSVVKGLERSEAYSGFKSNLHLVLEFLKVPEDQRDRFCDQESEKLGKVLLAFHEITARANDKHINPVSVLQNLTRAVFMQEAISLQTVRCLRWCYPNKVLEITPHGGDYMSKDTNGNPIIRRETTEKQKLIRWKNAVVEPISYHGIPIRDITLLAAGDYDLVGPGFGYSENDSPPTNARNYIDDLTPRVASWQLFKEYEVRVVSFRDLIRSFGEDKFGQLLAKVNDIYENLMYNPRLNFAGYNQQEIERMIDAEHQTRMPFIEGWTRQRSRDLTKHKLCMELALGSIMSMQQDSHPVILTVSGTQPAALSFGRGYLLSEGCPQLPITLFKSINDGQQPSYYQGASEVVI